MKFYLTVWSISWALNMRVMKTLEVKVKMMKRKIKRMMSNKLLRLKSQNLKEKTPNQQQSQVKQNLKKSQNAKTNETPSDLI